MKRFRWMIPFVLLALIVLVVPIPMTAAPISRTITLNLKQFEFMPGRLEVNQGDRVVITLQADDVVHGFYLDGYGIDQRVEPGVARQVEFVADQPGKFRYRCSVSCGSLHPFMIGELVVNANSPFWKAVGLIAIALAGMIVYLGTSTGVVDEQKTS